jgi:CMP-N-acetylneuraminic acid synthetase
MSKRKVVALLPMKANSERVKGKNFRTFVNKPLFKWILDSLLDVDEISQVVINTDARDILAENGLIESNRILIRDRKEELCGDFVSMNKILLDDINEISADLYLMTHTTNPLLTATTIKSAIQKYDETLADGKCDSLFSVTRYQTRFYREDGTAINHDPKNLLRTQDLEPWYEENSNLYIFTANSFESTGARIGENPVIFETPVLESIDIDEQSDWNLAEAVSKIKQ